MAKKRYAGGKVPEVAFGNKDVIEEAKEKKHGGKVAKIGGGKIPPRLDKRRRTGGRVGSDASPLSSAYKATSAPAD